VKDLIRSHSELRAALILAGKEIRRLHFGKKDRNRVLPILRRTLRESRIVAKRVQGVRMMDLQQQFPIIPHESASGVDCCGCIVVVQRGNDAELRCNECGAVVSVVNVGILRDLVSLI
jgi:hypothetical protein